MEPIHRALDTGWPEAEAINILDDGLSMDRSRDVQLTEAMTDRIMALARYAHRAGAEGILFTCSAFGPAIEQADADLPIPVLKPNEAMFETAMGYGTRIGMLATFGPAVATMEAEFEAEARRLVPQARLTTVLVPQAMEALRNGDAPTHNRLVAEHASRFEDVDALILAHFSTSRAGAAVREVTRFPVLTSPEAAVTKLRRLVTRTS